MISVKLYGRIGNMTFQIATCIATALRNGTDYCIPYKSTNPKIWKTYYDFPRRMPVIREYWREQGHAYTPIPNKKFLMLDGYFQSEKYFKDYREEIINLLGYQWTPIKGMVAVHIRRGDYLNYPDKHPVVSFDYLNNSILHFWNLGYRNFTFFSDDIPWCKEHFPGYNYSERMSEKKDIELISCCEHQIIANSSFSWWGAWLNRNPDKIVIAPKVWFGTGNAHLDTKDLYCEGWLKM